MRLSVDDGCASDVKVADLASKYEIECIFYWPVEWRSLAYDNGYEPLDLYDALKISKTFEIGSHTLTHRHLTRIDIGEAVAEIIYSKLMLERLFDIQIKKFCPPRGYTNQKLNEIILEYYDEIRLTRGKNLVHIHPDSGANNNRPWRECITKDTDELWMHSWELDKYDLWTELEEYLSERTYS